MKTQPLKLHMTHTVHADPERLREYVSNPKTMDDYCPGLTGTVVTPPQDGQDGIYRTGMKWLGINWRADMTWHPTEDGAVLQGAWKGPLLRPFAETLKLSVKPNADGCSAEFTKDEVYRFPKVLVPIFPFLRFGLTRVAGQSAVKLEKILQAQASPDQSPTEFQHKYGPWAVVTGGSGSIGAEFAQQLAKRGLNLVLTARDAGHLEKTADEIQRQYGVQVKTVACDLGQPDAADQLDEATRKLDVGLLVNTAGDFQTGPFLSQDPDAQAHLVDANVKTPMLLAHKFGERLAARHRGGLVLTAAGSAFNGAPTVANYAASKAYVVNLAEGLKAELKPAGVDVMALVLGPTPPSDPHNTITSQGVDFSRSPIPKTTPQQVVATALHDLGKKTRSVPGVFNRAAMFVQQHVLGRDISTAVAGHAIAQLQGFRSVSEALESRP
ncbi:MAG TPA: SDR family NAD(P)-dependent oxidoreductase [Candidatus Xenobia bacterium]